MENTQQIIKEENKENVMPEIKKLSGGLEILVQLAERGEIDPWDIDIIEVTDKFLTALDKSPRENLLNAGRAIFFASVLLRLKSDILLNLSNETLLASRQTEDFFPEDALLSEDEMVRIDPSKLESYLIRSPLSKLQRKRKISLGDLIFALQQAEEEEERRALRAKLKADRAFTIIAPETPDDIFEIAYEEDIEDVIEKIEAVVQEHLTDEKPITLTFLTEILNNKIKPFLAILFLAHSQKIVLEQKETYEEVFIHKSGTIIEGASTEQEESKVKPLSRKNKKSIIERIREKLPRKKKKAHIEPACTNTVKDEMLSSEITVCDFSLTTNNEKEMTNNGNNA